MGVFIYYRNWRWRWWQISRTIEPCYIRAHRHTLTHIIHILSYPQGNRQNYTTIYITWMYLCPIYMYSIYSCVIWIYYCAFFYINYILFNYIFCKFSVGRRELHKFWKGHQLAVVRRVRCHQAKCQQLGVDAFYRARSCQSHLHRSQVYHSRLFAVPGVRVVVQRNVFTALLWVWRGH